MLLQDDVCDAAKRCIAWSGSSAMNSQYFRLRLRRLSIDTSKANWGSYTMMGERDTERQSKQLPHITPNNPVLYCTMLALYLKHTMKRDGKITDALGILPIVRHPHIHFVPCHALPAAIGWLVDSYGQLIAKSNAPIRISHKGQNPASKHDEERRKRST